MIEIHAAGGEAEPTRLLLSPNPPMTARRQGVVLGALGSIMAVYGIALAGAGFWPVLPFCGLEFAALAAILRLTTRRGRRRETIEITPALLRVTRSGTDGAQKVEFPSAWARVRLARGAVAWYPSHLLLGAHGRWVEVGQFLNEADRRGVARELRRALGPYSAWTGGQ